MDYEIVSGAIVVSGGVTVIADHENVKVVAIDFASKYAEVMVHGFSEHENQTYVRFQMGERTIGANLERKDVPTSISIPGEWYTIAEVARYTAIVCFYKYTWSARPSD